MKTHPGTRRKSLFIGRHAYEIPGMSRDEAQALLDDLLDFAVRPPRVYKHQWKPGDIMMWDNRCIYIGPALRSFRDPDHAACTRGR